MVLTNPHGDPLEVAPGELDLERFADAAERGRDALPTGRPRGGRKVVARSAVAWRGPPLAEFTYQRFAESAIAQIEELHLPAVEERVEADLALGQARQLVGELGDLVARHPLRERPHGS